LAALPQSHRVFRAIITCLIVVSTLAACSSLPDKVEHTPSYSLERAPDTALARELQPLLEQNPELSGFLTLRQGESAFAARLRLIEAAEFTIDAQYYIWHDDLTGRVLHNRLLAAADRGVRVRLLLDDLDTAGKDEILRHIDAHPNVEVRLFNPFANRDLRAGDFITDTRRVNHRMHNKTLTIDALATIFGGRNIGDEYFAATTELGFGDLDALGIGPIALEVSDQFDLYWNSDMAYPMASFNWDEALDAPATRAFREQSNAHLEAAIESEYAEVIRRFTSTYSQGIEDLALVWSDWLLVYDQPDKLRQREITDGTHLAPKLLQGMENTQRDLIIVSPYFVPGEQFTAYLGTLVERGVRVRILTNSLQANDVSLVHAGYMRYRRDLIEHGVELYEYKANATGITRSEREAKARGERRIGASRASLHAKFFGFDAEYLFVGSFNLDPRSVMLNTELGAYYASPGEAKDLSDRFDATALRIAYRVTLDEDGGLQWVTIEDGQEVRHDAEPDTTAWKRFSTRILSTFVPESQL
jgi:putative cardiolipin synthase